MFTIDTFRLIKKTSKRFISILCIVFIGIAFMMGLFVTPSIMRESVDKYNKDINLFDLQIYSTFGFCEEDISEISKLDYIKDVYASKQVDAFLTNDDETKKVIRIREVDTTINGFELVEGRLPINDKEIVLLGLGLEQYPINSKVKVFLESDDILEQLKYQEYTVVGYVKSSEYMAKLKSTSNLNNLDLELIGYIDNNNFLSEYYTTVFLTGRHSRAFNVFSNGYDKYISSLKDDLKEFSDVQQEYNKENILEKALKELEDGKQKLEEESQKALKELDDAKRQLDDAKKQLDDGQRQLDEGYQQIKDNEKKLNDSEKELLENKKLVDDAINEIETSQGKSFDEVVTSITALYETYIALERSKEELPEDVKQEIVGALEQQKENQDAIIEGLLERLEGLDETVDAALVEYLKEQLKNAQDRSDEIQDTIDETLGDAKGDYDKSIDVSLALLDEQANGSVKDTYNQLMQLKDAKQQIEDGYAQIIDGRVQLENAKKLLQENQLKIQDGYKEYNDGLKKYKDGLKEYEKGIDEAKSKLKKAQQDIDELPDASWMILGHEANYANYMYANTCDQMRSICIIMPFLFYLVAALVCLTTMTRLIDEQRGQIGIYLALGYSKKQIIFKYITYCLIAALTGSILGIIVGSLIFPSVIYMMWRLMYDLPKIKFVVPLYIILICILAFSLLMVIVTCFVVNKSLKETPASLLRPKAPKNAKKVFLEYIKILWNKLSFTGKITARNLIRYKTRFWMSVIGIAGCTSLLVLGFGIKDSIGDIVNIQFKDIFDYQYTINLKDDKNIDEMLERLDNNEDIAVPLSTYYSKIYLDNKDNTLQIIVVDKDQMNDIFNLKDAKTKESLSLSDKGVIISEKFAKVNNIKVNDIITIESKQGIKADVKVEAITEMYFQHYIYISSSFYHQIFDENVKYTSIAVSSTKDIDTIVDKISDIEGYASTTDFSSFISQFNVMIEALDLIIIVIIVTAGSLSFVVLFNLIQVNISERIREIATLKVLGFRNNEVDSYLFKEILLLTLIGAIFGLPLGNIELDFVMSVIDMEMIMFPTNIKLLSYIYGFSITFVFTVIVLIYTKRQLRNIQMVESLKSVE